VAGPKDEKTMIDVIERLAGGVHVLPAPSRENLDPPESTSSRAKPPPRLQPTGKPKSAP
jgi:hypothetical protein